LPILMIIICSLKSEVIAGPKEWTDKWPPNGKSIKCDITRDTSLSSLRDEANGSNGGSRRLKLKGNQEYILIDIDPELLKGKIIKGALLHVRSDSTKKAPFLRVGVSTLASSWDEGNSSRYRPQEGASSYNQAQYLLKSWSYQGSTLMDVTFGRGNTVWKFADCSEPDNDGWQTCAIDADVVASRVAGLSEGFCLYDEIGNTWSLQKGKFEYAYFPNRLCYSRESFLGKPYMEVWIEGDDKIPPEPVEFIDTEDRQLDNGQTLVSWITPQDRGGGKVLGFSVGYKTATISGTVPRYLVPMASKAGQRVYMYLRDMSFRPGENIELSVRSIDTSGNISAPYTTEITASVNKPFPGIYRPKKSTPSWNYELPIVGGVKVAIVDMLDKIDPVTGEMIPAQIKGYKGSNHLYSSKNNMIRLYAARNEAVGFQINFEGVASKIISACEFKDSPNIKPRMYEFGYVNIGDEKCDFRNPLPDPLLPSDGSCSIPSDQLGGRVEKQTNHSLICEIYIPHEQPKRMIKGKLTIQIGNEDLIIPVELNIWDFTLPDKLSFIPEMNAYGTVSVYKGYDYYRLAHENRTCINRLPYGWNGKPEFSPQWMGDGFEWSNWDRYIGPLLDGSVFADLPRKGEPVDVLYLPFNENWPADIHKNYRASYWADEAFTSEYRDELKEAFTAFAIHCNEKQWHDTKFQFYLNNKIIYRLKFEQSSAPWLFDEPMNTQDFWALRWYGKLWHDAVDAVRGDANMHFRADISYRQFERNILWGILDVEYIGGNNLQKTRMKIEEKIHFCNSDFAEYGTANRIDQPNIQPVLWSLSAWSNGAVGVLPWQTIGSKRCWENAEQTALFYPNFKGGDPLPSIRLKAFRRGQQDVEYLTLLGKVYDIPRCEVANWLKEQLPLGGKILKAYQGDAGTVNFNGCNLMDIWNVRVHLAEMISKRSPEYMRCLTGPFKNKHGKEIKPDIGYVTTAPNVKQARPLCDSF
jgi:hypothetical protein